MLTMPSFKKSLIVEQFQGNYLKAFLHVIHQTRLTLFQTVALIFSIQILFQNFLIYDLLNILSLGSLLLFSQVVFLLFLHVDFDNLTI